MESEISRVKIAFFGPPKAGKSTYKAVLLHEKGTNVKKPTNTVETIERTRQFKKRVKGEFRPIEKYKLVLTDLPGREKFRQERLKEIAKGVVGCVFFYNASNPSSAKKLLEMTREEIIRTEYLERFLGVQVLGNIKEEISPKAIEIAEKLKEQLNDSIQPLWGYEVPHLLISCKRRSDVLLSFFMLESILSSKETPKSVLNKYSAKNFFEKKPKTKPTPTKQPEPTPTQEQPKQPTKQPKQPEPTPTPTPTQEQPKQPTKQPKQPKPTPTPRLLNYSISFFPMESKAWIIPKKIVERFKTVRSSILSKVKGQNTLYVSYFPGKKEYNAIPKRNAKFLIFFKEMMKEVGELRQIVIQGDGNESFVLFNRESSQVLLEVEGEPSKEILSLF